AGGTGGQVRTATRPGHPRRGVPRARPPGDSAGHAPGRRRGHAPAPPRARPRRGGLRARTGRAVRPRHPRRLIPPAAKQLATTAGRTAAAGKDSRPTTTGQPQRPRSVMQGIADRGRGCRRIARALLRPWGRKCPGGGPIGFGSGVRAAEVLRGDRVEELAELLDLVLLLVRDDEPGFFQDALLGVDG